ncbi:NBS-LRR type resistance protein [Cucumis melo var. makuwa]|uniref:NBS-LRR type resistance protein n=1 Tax=Cucumis melo var. makuwa TaxID=1194695 RepID=A0A5D3BWG6_CUCMM|nr:NBS-LRR type resistance protein [Cucumis melo var. makuwa]
MKITSNKIQQWKHKENQTRPYGLHASFLPLVGLSLAVPLPEKLKRKRFSGSVERTHQSRDPEGCTYQSSDPKEYTYQFSDPKGHTYQSSDPEGYTYQSSDLEGWFGEEGARLGFEVIDSARLTAWVDQFAARLDLDQLAARLGSQLGSAWIAARLGFRLVAQLYLRLDSILSSAQSSALLGPQLGSVLGLARLGLACDLRLGSTRGLARLAAWSCRTAYEERITTSVTLQGRRRLSPDLADLEANVGRELKKKKAVARC